MQKRAANRHPPVRVEQVADAINSPQDQAIGEEHWRKNILGSFNLNNGYAMFQSTDTFLSIRQVLDTSTHIADLCAQGNLDALQDVFKNIRAASSYSISG